jgi:uncharacterized protein (UPF0332 family)
MISAIKEITALLNKAESKLKTARIDFDSGQYDDAVSRAYYAAFHAISAALLSKNLTFSSHGQLIGAFNREFINNGIFPEEYSSLMQQIFKDRQVSDYDPITEITEETAQKHIKTAETIINAIKSYCKIT